MYCNVSNEYKKFKKSKISHIFLENIKSFYCLQTVWSQIQKTFKEEEPIEILKILALINNREEYQKISSHA